MGKIKSSITKAALLAGFVLVLCGTARAQWEYVTSNGAVTITGYTGPGGAVSVPTNLSGLPVVSIGESAFYAHPTVTSVAFPTTLTNIGSGAFMDCTGVTNFVLPNGLLAIGDVAFMGCAALTTASIGNGTTSIGSSVFEGCTNLLTINMAAENPHYGSVAGVLFDKTQASLVAYPGGKAGSYAVPGGTASIGDGAFAECARVTQVIIPGSVTNIGGFAFFSSSVSDADINEGVSAFGVQAFWGCANLRTVKLPGSLGTMDAGAFGGCSSLTNVTLGTGFVSLGDSAFSGCSSLGTISLPASLRSVGDFAFSSTGLKNVLIPAGVTNIGSAAFRDCGSLLGMSVDPLNSAYCSVDGVLFDSTKTVLNQFPGGKTGSYSIPAGTAIIGEGAFYDCTGLSAVTLPATVATIADQAFFGCTNLLGLYFSGNAPLLGADAFVDDASAIVYYLPGTTGWGATYGGLPTAVWSLPRPVLLASGIRSNGFGFVISWANNGSVVVEACTNIAQPNWLPLATNALSGGSAYFHDPQWASVPNRFYRARAE